MYEQRANGQNLLTPQIINQPPKFEKQIFDMKAKAKAKDKDKKEKKSDTKMEVDKGDLVPRRRSLD